MFTRIRKNRAQSTLEYAILIGVIVAGLIGMQVYLKRGYQGKLRASADDMGDQFSAGYSTYSYKTSTNTSSTEDVKDETTTTTIHNQETTKTGNESTPGFDKEFWFK
jgi:uncharacterized protein (UPF0333 family)